MSIRQGDKVIASNPNMIALQNQYSKFVKEVEDSQSAFNEEVNAKFSGKQNVATDVEYTLLASNWTGDEAPYVYDFTEAYPDISYDINAVANIEALTEEQRTALISAVTVSTTSNKLIALGEKPSIDIPIILKVVSK